MRVLLVPFVALGCLALSCPPAGAAEPLLGLKVAEAKKTDFFTFFHLDQTASDTDAKKRTVLTFKPTAEAFRKLVTVKVTLDKEDRIQSFQLALARSFIEDRVNGVFARDIAKSLMHSALSEKEKAKVGDLINEIEWGSGGTVIGRQKPPKLPDPPTPGYLTFLGKRDSYEQDLGRTKLELRQQKSDKEAATLAISVGLKD